MQNSGRTFTEILRIICIVLLCASVSASIASATEPVKTTTGPITNLPMPRYVSMKASEANVRRGPSLTHRIDWVFKRRDMPLLIVAEHGHWRRVEDRDGQGGWIHYSLLSGVRTVIVEETLNIHSRPNTDSPVNAMLEAGVIARLGKCEPDWCQVRSGGFRGWTPKTLLWGVLPDEVRD
ncbi:SH3 domain-containing protein [Roseobacter sp. OBYS 0001]|uniref:SH3 domain-containing protein n=1 Tax=Roseobacter sp. OBYS 0001 TaxID=882651 RepID=UPI001C7FEB83|nr:SH3 domain-containing protein [Roseobacter sp. OBYS 0001]